MIFTTLCYIEYNNHLLMLYRNAKSKDENKGKWIGVGGKIEQGESPLLCINREIMEETGFTNLLIEYRGVILFNSDICEAQTMYLYTAGLPDSVLSGLTFDEHGLPQLPTCSEGHLEWIPKAELFKLPIWEGDRIFLELLLEDAEFFRLDLNYESDKLVSSKLIQNAKLM